ncbi:NAD-dependent epimerase/dehydratase family protein [Salinispirillum sp. LH 10-3-1]|uniref:NAD-dependent epimerase/dehydratase family protein n=1 Tax=Salinispirillum sp. LH 10-3-1 TaxID=2952525 RepID=A0AB38YF61_9GAMM
MSTKIPSAMLMGATGLVGSAALPLLAEQFDKVLLPGRRLPEQAPSNSEFIATDFTDFSVFNSQVDEAPDVLCIAFGTTIKQAGSQARFQEIDYDYPLALARWAVERGTLRVCLISAVGANAQSKVFYNRVKGALEDALYELPIRSLYILRPSLLLGPHAQRPMEHISQKLFGPIAPIMPASIRPIEAKQLAQKLVACAVKPAGEGRVILEGKSLFS